ncbi:hypothetical protein [Synechococcus sp. ROS8604]|uniref:hypothetical protein n=1 Tax=Synechococcus sp. ROS8604 TaxID=1442557 RepID=UPI00164421FC|nr:hypothetical protein [Synechococcus sp. ROS8604]QNI87716.1 hypothetical protein SynROS8604_01073 [Synechococcus sp. ROS8604]
MSESLNSFSKESGQDPDEVKRHIQETYKDIFPVINAVSVAGDAVDLFNRWENEFSNGGNFSILYALAIFNDLDLISVERHENALLLLDYASSHNIIDLDCSEFVRNKESSTLSSNEITIEQLRQSVINDYAYICADDGGTESDEMSLDDYKKSVSEMSWEELMQESSVNVDEPSDNPYDMTLEEYVNIWGARSNYAELIYTKNEDGSTSLIEEN